VSNLRVDIFDGWRTIPEFPKYAVNQEGFVKNIKFETLLNGVGNRGPNVRYSLRKDGKNHTRSGRALVLSAFPETVKAEDLKKKGFHAEYCWQAVDARGHIVASTSTPADVTQWQTQDLTGITIRRMYLKKEVKWVSEAA